VAALEHDQHERTDVDGGDAAAPSTEAPWTLTTLATSGRPLAEQTASLFAAVRDHDLPRLEELCDDDFGIIDIAPDGGSVVLPDQEAWRAWFVQLFGQLDAMRAATDTFVTSYEVSVWSDAAMSVVGFVQTLTIDGVTARFTCVVTIVWKQVDGRWWEARWHASLIDTDIPEGFGAA
jgi:hypothetical protein